MASIKINKALTTFSTELAIETVDKLFAFLGEKVELDEDWTGYFAEFKEQLKKAATAPAAKETKESKAAAKAAAKEAKDAKPKRAPTAYNTFIGVQMAALKDSKPTMTAKDRMKEASALWKASDEAAAAEATKAAAKAAKAAKAPRQKKEKAVVPAVVAPAAPTAPTAPAEDEDDVSDAETEVDDAEN